MHGQVCTDRTRSSQKDEPRLPCRGRSPPPGSIALATKPALVLGSTHCMGFRVSPLFPLYPLPEVTRGKGASNPPTEPGGAPGNRWSTRREEPGREESSSAPDAETTMPCGSSAAAIASSAPGTGTRNGGRRGAKFPLNRLTNSRANALWITDAGAEAFLLSCLEYERELLKRSTREDPCGPGCTPFCCSRS